MDAIIHKCCKNYVGLSTKFHEVISSNSSK